VITVSQEQLVDVLEELKPLFIPHYQELALNQDTVPLDPQYEVYLEREAAGQVLCVIARDAGEICAYFVGFIAPGLHYASCLTLTMDIFWLHPDYRDQDSLSSLSAEMLSEQLFEEVKRCALARGVQRVFYGTKNHHFAGLMFERMGLNVTDTYYSAWWGG